MVSLNQRWIAALVVAGACLPAQLAAQTAVSPTPAGTFSKTRLESAARTIQTPSNPTGASRGHHVLWGTLVGAGAGLVFGELVLGQQLDMPHGPDMLIGAAIGAGAGALVGAVLRPNTRTRPVVGIAPVVSRTRKAVFLTLPLGQSASRLRE